jgi:outer membrane protein
MRQISIFALIFILPIAPVLYAQQPRSVLPDAPSLPELAVMQSSSAVSPMTQSTLSSSATPDTGAQKLTLADAERMAIEKNPRITAAHLLALAQRQVVREARSAELPTLTGNMTAMQAEDASRISAGSLTASRLFEHAGAGANFTQLITDFGKTRNMVASAKLQAEAQDANTLATKEDIVLAADAAFYNALKAQALLHVAEESVRTRGTTQEQVSSMAKNKLKSDLDLSFANVSLSEAKLLAVDAQNDVDASMAALDAVLGLDHSVQYELVKSDDPLSEPPANVDELTQMALRQRPDLQALTLSQQSETKLSHAQRDQMLPSITAAGTAGSVPIRPAEYYTENWWGGIGVNVNIPIFNGFLYSAQAREATLRAQAAGEQGRELKDRIVRDVRTAWLGANAAYQRMAVTQEMLQQADLALRLAETRYKLGLSSIVELSQAQLQQTDAAVSHTNARYSYRLALATLNYQTGTMP